MRKNQDLIVNASDIDQTLNFTIFRFRETGVRLLAVLCLLFAAPGFSQTTVKYEASAYGLISPKEGQMPHWLIYNRNGIFKGDRNEFVSRLDLDFEHTFGKWTLEAGLSGVGKFPMNESHAQEAYLNLSYGKLKLITGLEEQRYGDYHPGLSSGSFYISGNARPFPRVGAGFYEYVDVPFTNGYVQVRGFLNQGILNDDRGPLGTDKPLFHEKTAYIRTNKLPVNLHVGVSHSALFGGTHRNGSKIPVDYFATFFANPSDKVGKVFWGEATNVAGGHFGVFDFGADFKVEEAEVQTYFQIPVRDMSGMNGTFRKNKDHIFGISVKNINSSLISEFSYERVNTKWQCGPGLPDPVVNGKYYVAFQITDYDKFLFDNYGIVVENISEHDFWLFIRKKENYGYLYGGRDSYYNNGMYYKGWSYHGAALGNSLLLTLDRVKSINPGFDGSYDSFFANTRVSAHHFGVRGAFAKNLDYRLLYTHTYNLGTYAGLNKGCLNWDSMNPDSDYKYYFTYPDSDHIGKNEAYILLETVYTLPSAPHFKLNLNVGFDYGRLYRNYGVLAGLTYTGHILKKK